MYMLKRESIVFEDGVYYDGNNEISVYMWSTKGMNQFFGFTDADYEKYNGEINHYAVYNYENDSFKVEAVVEKRYVITAKLNHEDEEMIFNLFKNYCISDLSEYLESVSDTDNFMKFVNECGRKLAA